MSEKSGHEAHCRYYFGPNMKCDCGYDAPPSAAPVAQEAVVPEPEQEHLYDATHRQYARGWNACRDAMLKALRQPITGNLAFDMRVNAGLAPPSDTHGPVAQEGDADEFSTEGVKRVADRMRRDGQPILASALMDLAEQRDTLSAQLAEREREVFQWQANSRENKLIAEGCSRREQEAEQKLAASEARVGVLTEAVKANHQWHLDYDDHDGYQGSALHEINHAALAGSTDGAQLQWEEAINCRCNTPEEERLCIHRANGGKCRRVIAALSQPSKEE